MEIPFLEGGTAGPTLKLWTRRLALPVMVFLAYIIFDTPLMRGRKQEIV
jgi:hypothetical protein